MDLDDLIELFVIVLVFLIVVVMPVAVAIAFHRLRDIGKRVRGFDNRLHDALITSNSIESALRRLEERFARLEAAQFSDESKPTTPAPEPAIATPQPASIHVENESKTPELKLSPWQVPPELSEHSPTLQPAPHVSERRQPPIALLSASARAFARGVREQFAGEEWEAIVGGNWLNKLGVLVLVIGISLFLAHITHHGPLARIATGLAVSLAMLAGGVVLERRARYVIVSRGLIGGGWAALYTTAYAAHAFESARVIESPLIASLVLCVVALGMILHSLRYRSEVVTGVAYFVGFATLAISPITSLALFASVLLIASMLYLAYRFTWERMAVAGVVVAYVTYIWGAKIPADTHLAFVSGQVALAAYWLLFEAFDLVGLMRRENRDDAVKALAALNAVGFLGMATIEWSAYSPSTIHILFTYAAIAFAATAALRWKLVPPTVVEPSSKIILERIEAGSFEVAATLASGLMAAAIFYRFTGYAINVALLLEAEFLFILGLRLQLKYLRTLGGAVFAIAAGKVIIYDPQDDAKTVIAGHPFYAWTPTAILTAAAGYANRIGFKGWRAFAWTATFILWIVLAQEIPNAYVGLGWIILGGCLFEYGIFTHDFDWRLQGYAASTLGVVLLAWINGVGDFIFAANPHPWIALAPAAIMAFAATLQMMRETDATMPDPERSSARDAASAAGVILAMLLAWQMLPATAVAVAWIALAIVMVEAGFATGLLAPRVEGYALAACAFARLFLANFTATGSFGIVSERSLTVVPVIVALYYVAQRLDEEKLRLHLEWFEYAARRVFLHAGAILIVVLIRFEAGRVAAVIGWSVFAVILLEAGLRLRDVDFRYQSYALAAATFARSWASNFYIPGSLGGMPERVLTGAIVIGCLYACEMLAPRSDRVFTPTNGNPIAQALEYVDLNARTIFSILASALLALLLFYEISGRL
ncbi:MAG TPA: DUF2339 domain-containing protein, partial [Candidatus Binatus sp.]|nr:DUF2339 domain-containing protein [Candidatus Binatus sp.]